MDNKPLNREPDPERNIRSAPPVPKNIMSGVHKPTYASGPSRPVVPRQPARQPVASTRDEIDAEPEMKLDHDSRTVNATEQTSKQKGVMHAFWRHKLWTLPLAIIGLLIITGGVAFALPTTRYQILGIFIQRAFAVTVTDSTTGAPVTGATIKIAGQSKQTDSRGQASLTVPVGNSTLQVTKTYYKDYSKSMLVDITAAHNTLAVSLVATGRQVPVKVANKITGKAIPEAVITVGNSNAKTDENGLATIVLSATPDSQDATVTVDGYNDLSTKVQVTTQVVDANTLAMVPVGKVYFLSNLSGKLDVISTNLDGSARKTVLAGTGLEDANNTFLLASRDWKYLALLSKRDGGDHAKLFLITAGSDKVTTIDSTAADFSLLGWSDHYFMYQLTRSGTPAWQPNAVSFMSYSADANKALTLLSTTATGTSNADAQYENVFQEAIIGGNLVYAKTWYRYPGYIGVSGQQNVLASIKPDGSGAKTLKSVDASQYYISSLKLAKPDQLYFAVYDNNSSNPNFYRLDASGNVTQSDTITSDSVSRDYPTYLASPSNSATFWSEQRDGKNALFVGDTNGNGGSQIASLSDYAPYGWFSDSYLLVQKSRSELYIMPAAGGTPLKVSDYYKPDYSFYGYGGGYGGI